MSKTKWGVCLTLVLCLVTGLALVPPAMGTSVQPSGRNAPAKVARSDARFAKQYWTKARMRNATPMTVTVAGGEGGSTTIDRGAPVTLPPATSPVTAPSFRTDLNRVAVTEGYWQGSTLAQPARTIGKLFFQEWDSRTSTWVNYVCSASIVGAENKSVLWTAGHCVFETINNNYNRAFQFCPSYTRDGCINGVWTPRLKNTTTLWKNANGCSYTATGISCTEPSFDADFGTLVMRSNSAGRLIQNVTGAQHLSVNYPASQVDAVRILYGYPGNKDQGRSLYWCSGSNTHTSRFHLVMSPCGAGGGASGGPWMWNFNAQNLGDVVSVNSHGSGYMHGPYQGQAALDLYNTVRNA
jgi:hypothetical protein